MTNIEKRAAYKGVNYIIYHTFRKGFWSQALHDKTGIIIDKIYFDRLEDAEEHAEICISSYLQDLEDSNLLNEAPKNNKATVSATVSNSDSLKAQGVRPQAITAFEKSIKEWKRLEEELSAKREQFNASLQKEELEQERHLQIVFEKMKEFELDVYEVNKIVATLTAEGSRTTVGWKKIVAEALTQVNDEAKKIINTLTTKHSTTKPTERELTIENRKLVRKLIEALRKESGVKVILKENVLDWLKRAWVRLTSLFSSFKNKKNKLKSLIVGLQENKRHGSRRRYR